MLAFIEKQYLHLLEMSNRDAQSWNYAWNQVIIIINAKQKKKLTLPFYLLPAAPALIRLWI